MDIEEVYNLNRDKLERIRAHASHIIILGQEGAVLHSKMDVQSTRAIASKVWYAPATTANNAIRDFDPADEMHFMRIATKTYEIIVAPDKDFTLAAVGRKN